MSDFLKDLSGGLTLPVVYIFTLSVAVELLYRLTALDYLDSSLHYAGGVFVGLSVVFSVCSQLISLKETGDVL